MIKSFFIAIGLLTRIPVPKLFHVSENDSEKLFGWSPLFYPLVGLLIGALLAGFSLLLSSVNDLLAAVLILLVWVLISGALHLDGLADSADAWLGGYGDKQRTLDIMKDPYSGPAAVVILVLLLLLKFSALVSLPAEIQWQVLLIAPVIGRTAAMLLLATTPYVRSGGMGETAANHLPKPAVWLVSLLVIGLMMYLFGQLSFALIAIFIIGYLLRLLMKKRIGGTTGDTTGALIEIIEAASLVIFILLLS